MKLLAVMGWRDPTMNIVVAGSRTRSNERRRYYDKRDEPDGDEPIDINSTTNA